MPKSNRYNKQNFKPATKQVISEKLLKKAEENMHIIPVTKGDIVVYRTLTESRPFYKVGMAKGVRGMYDVEVIKLDSSGQEMSQRFNTTMDKLERYWLQLDDVISSSKKNMDGTHYKIQAISGDLADDICIQVISTTGSTQYLFDLSDIPYIDLVPED